MDVSDMLEMVTSEPFAGELDTLAFQPLHSVIALLWMCLLFWNHQYFTVVWVVFFSLSAIFSRVFRV